MFPILSYSLYLRLLTPNIVWQLGIVSFQFIVKACLMIIISIFKYCARWTNVKFYYIVCFYNSSADYIVCQALVVLRAFFIPEVAGFFMMFEVYDVYDIIVFFFNICFKTFHAAIKNFKCISVKDFVVWVCLIFYFCLKLLISFKIDNF